MSLYRQTKTRSISEDYEVYYCGSCGKELGEPGSEGVLNAYSVNFTPVRSGFSNRGAAHSVVCRPCAQEEARKLSAEMFAGFEDELVQ